jgi:DnaJ-class molecular chaperone
MGKDQRRLYVCSQCHGAQVILEWRRASLAGYPELQEAWATQNCPTCDGSGQILGPAT